MSVLNLVEFWSEILDTVRGNRMRTLLTLFGVFWGIFLLVVLLGAGTGLHRGIVEAYGGRSLASGYLYAFPTTLANQGFRPGRKVVFNNRDTDAILARVPGIDALAARQRLEAKRGISNVANGEKTGSFTLCGDTTAYFRCTEVTRLSGRLLNQADIRERRKVALIGREVQTALFEPGEDPIGARIEIRGVSFQVIGVYESLASGESASKENRSVYMPLGTLQWLGQLGDSLLWYWFSVKPGYQVAEVGDEITALLKERHVVHPDDSAIWLGDNQADYRKYKRLIDWIRWVVLFVGLGSLFTGSIGISNIMLIVVKERVGEIGIRKALGATPFSIVSMILLEALVLTAFAGIFGLIAGVWTLEAVNFYLERHANGAGLMSEPHIELRMAVAGLLIIATSGCLAGLVPAVKAASIRPAEAIMTAI